MLDDTAAEPPPGTGYAEVTDSLGTGVVLVAHPLLGGIFGRSVVLLTEHNNRGTFGERRSPARPSYRTEILSTTQLPCTYTPEV